MERNDFKVTEKFKPGEDFYMYSNKYWIENNPMPSDKSRYATFDKLHEENLERLMELIDKPSANLPIPLQMNIINLRDKYLERDYFENSLSTSMTTFSKILIMVSRSSRETFSAHRQRITEPWRPPFP